MNLRSGRYTSCPNMEDFLRQMTATMQALAANLPAAPVPQAPPAVTPLPAEFHGLPYEDPVVFSNDLETFFATAHTPEREKARIAASLLKNEASKWYGIYQNLNWPWETFRERLLAEYNAPCVLANSRTDLYGRHQTVSEPVMLFLEEKVRLAARLQPELQAQELVALLIELLHPRIQRFIYAAAPRTVQDLLSHARLTEKSFKADTAAKTSKAVNQPATEDTAKNTVPAAPRTAPRAAPHTAPPAYNRQPPKCHFCPGRHYHRDCPVLRERSGNGSPVGPRNYPEARPN